MQPQYLLARITSTSLPLGQFMDLLIDGCLERKTIPCTFRIVDYKCCTSVTPCSGISPTSKKFHWAVILSELWEALTFDMWDITTCKRADYQVIFAMVFQVSGYFWSILLLLKLYSGCFLGGWVYIHSNMQGSAASYKINYASQLGESERQ